MRTTLRVVIALLIGVMAFFATVLVSEYTLWLYGAPDGLLLDPLVNLVRFAVAGLVGLGVAGLTGSGRSPERKGARRTHRLAR